MLTLLSIAVAPLWGDLKVGMTEAEISAVAPEDLVQLSDTCQMAIDYRFNDGRLAEVRLSLPGTVPASFADEDLAKLPCRAELDTLLKNRFGRWIDTNTIYADGKGTLWHNYYFVRECVVARLRISYSEEMATSVVFGLPKDGQYAVKDPETGVVKPLVCSTG